MSAATGAQAGARTRDPWWSDYFGPPVLAAQFLTALPLPLAVPAGPRHLGRSLVCFPLVGAAVGLALDALHAALRPLLPPGVVAALLLAAGTLLTGGLHLDGLMDTCDGVFGGRTPARRLEIMRDSRVGSFGVLGGALVLLLKLTTLSALVALPSCAAGLVVACLGGRWAMALCIGLFPYARPEGLGTAFKAGVTRPILLGATLVALALATAVTLLPGPYGLPLWLGAALLLLAGLVAGAVARFLAGRLNGGLTGDCYGATNEVVEVTLLLVLLAAAPHLGAGGAAA